MATAKKQPAAKKSTASSKTSSQSKSPKRRISAKALYTERHPDRHSVSGKYKFFYIMFACTTIFFAAVSVWLFAFSSDIMNKYESVESCVRAHTRCNVTADENGLKAEEK